MVRNLEGKHADYFEAVLQLRDCSEEVYNFVKKEISDTGLRIAKSKNVNNGYDYYTSDNNLTKNLGKKLQQHFGGNLIITASLHTKKKDKELYRLTVMFREAGFKKNDMVGYKGDDYQVKTMGGKEILLQNIKTGEKVHLKYKMMGMIRKRS